MGFDGTEIDALLREATAKGTFRGVAATVLGRDGVLYEGAFGEATPSTVFRNASMTKAVVTVAALQLVEQGRLDLDQEVRSVLPEFGELQVLEGFDGDEPRLRPPATQATIRQLMSHTSGCGYFFTNADLKRWTELTGTPDPLQGRRAALLAPLVRDPGTQWEYGTSTDWLGLVVEAVSGQPLEAYLPERVWGPLGATDTTFSPSAEQRARLAPLYVRTADGDLQPSPVDLAPEWDWAAGGHGSYGTLQDYGRFLRAILRDGELDGTRIIGTGALRAAFEDGLGDVPIPDPVAASQEPLLANTIPKLPVPQTWTLGFHRTDVDVPGMRSAGTLDWAGIFNSYYWIDRTAGIAGLLVTQVLPFFDPPVVEALVGFEAATYAQVGAAQPAAA